MGVRRVPTFFVNGKKIEGSASFEEFAAVIDAALEAHK
jgi:protein-disulfide isomerase